LSQIIESKILDSTVSKFLHTLDLFKELRPDLNRSLRSDSCCVNGYHTGNILIFKSTHELLNEILETIPYKDCILHHVHLIHFYESGYEKAHDHQATEDFSFILYLSDSEDGYTCFKLKEQIFKVKPEKGKIIFFPSNIWHWGDPSSGNKKIAVGALNKK
jgi:hypothetical protein|tara:strand:+ start:22 stop:501 length:480 start_codon:yes stop_codon:yes gene_type:complete